MNHTARRLCAALLALFGTLLLVAGPLGPVSAANAAPSSCNYPAMACACPTVSVSTTLPNVGERIRVTGADFVSGRKITLVLKPVRNNTSNTTYRVKTLRTRADGTFSTTIVMPPKAVGSYDLYAIGGTPLNSTTSAGISCPADPTARLRIGGGDDNRNNNNNDTPDTAFTGFNVLWLLLLAGALVGVGVYANRRGRKNEVRSIHG